MAHKRASYKRLVIRLHPDKNDNSDESKQNFQKLQEAYDILMDDTKRKLYDRTGSLETFSDSEEDSGAVPAASFATVWPSVEAM